MIPLARSFLGGLAAPGWVGVLGAGGIAVLWLVATLAGLWPSALAQLDEGWFLLHGRDSMGHLSHDIWVLQDQGTEPDTVLVLGNSSTRESIATVAVLDSAIETAAGRPVQTLEITGDKLGLTEYHAVLEAIPDGFSGVLAVAVSPWVMSLKDWTPSRRRHQLQRPLTLGWSSPARDRDLRQFGYVVPRRTGIYAVDQRDFLLARLAAPFARLLYGPAEFKRNQFRGRARPRDLAARDVGRTADVTSPASIALLIGMLDELEARSTRLDVVLVEQTEYPDKFQEMVGVERYRTYHDQMADIAAVRPRTEFVDLNEGLAPADFADLIHLGVPNPTYTRRLGAELGARLAVE